jgi:hypothetical protein
VQRRGGGGKAPFALAGFSPVAYIFALRRNLCAAILELLSGEMR